MLAAWPGDQMKLSLAAVPATLLAAVRTDADALAKAPNFWISRERLQAGPSACCTAAEAAIQHLYEHVMARRLPSSWHDDSEQSPGQLQLQPREDSAGPPEGTSTGDPELALPSGSGAEYWVQVYQPGRGLAFHFDKDEHLLQASGSMAHPMWSSILYLTGRSDSSAPGTSTKIQHIPQAPTVVLEQLFDAASGGLLPEGPQRCVLVYPREGAFLAFDGRLGHGVLDSFDRTSVRATLLVNWWAHRPRAVKPLQQADIQKYGLQRWADDCGMLEPGAQQQLGELTLDSNSSQQCQEREQQQQQRQQQRQQPVAGPAAHTTTASICTLKLQSNVPELVDDLLERHGLQLCGPEAVSAVAFDHAGFVLLPVDPEEHAACAAEDDTGGAPAQLQTAAAFVPAALLASSSDDDQDGAG